MSNIAADNSPEFKALIYFTDFFNVDAAILEEYGAFNISLINDLPLFIDPFLLFDSEDKRYTALHHDIINYVKFLRDISIAHDVTDGHFNQWFLFPEISQNWLGFSKTGNKGSGLGKDFANTLYKSLRNVFKDFGAETITAGSHLEKLCLIADGVGRDHLSDFTTNLIKKYLLEYTQTFAKQYIDPALIKTFPIERVSFDYPSKRWLRGKYDLPALDDDYVILTPKDILTKDEAWINRVDLLNDFHNVYQAMPNDQLRAQVSDYFYKRLSEDPTDQERREAAADTVDKFPSVLDYYVKDKEDNADAAHKQSALKVTETEFQFISQVNEFVSTHLVGTAFYELGNSFDEALRRVLFLKDVIENQDGYRLFYVKGQQVKREADLQLLYRLTWFATSYDVNREVNNGRGPVDFKISKGKANKSLVEFKLASNSKLKQNLKNQLPVYEAANDTKRSIKAILFFSDAEFKKLHDILKELELLDRADIVLIDACSHNKPSGSNA
jgi:hypothetical protein